MFKVHTVESAPEDSKENLKIAEGVYSFIPNLLGVLAEAPAALQGYMGLSKTYTSLSTLNPQEQQVVLLSASYENECTYCVAAHTGAGLGAGLQQDCIDALRDGTALPDARLNALCQFTKTMVLNRGFAPEDDVKTFLDAGFTRANILEVITGIALKTMSNYTNHVANTPLDSAFEPFAWKKAK